MRHKLSSLNDGFLIDKNCPDCLGTGQIPDEVGQTIFSIEQEMQWLDQHCSFVADHPYVLGPFLRGQLRDLAYWGLMVDGGYDSRKENGQAVAYKISEDDVSLVAQPLEPSDAGYWPEVSLPELLRYLEATQHALDEGHERDVEESLFTAIKMTKKLMATLADQPGLQKGEHIRIFNSGKLEDIFDSAYWKFMNRDNGDPTGPDAGAAKLDALSAVASFVQAETSNNSVDGLLQLKADAGAILYATMVNIRDANDPAGLTWKELNQIACEATKTYELTCDVPERTHNKKIIMNAKNETPEWMKQPRFYAGPSGPSGPAETDLNLRDALKQIAGECWEEESPFAKKIYDLADSALKTYRAGLGIVQPTESFEEGCLKANQQRRADNLARTQPAYEKEREEYLKKKHASPGK